MKKITGKAKPKSKDKQGIRGTLVPKPVTREIKPYDASSEREYLSKMLADLSLSPDDFKQHLRNFGAKFPRGMANVGSVAKYSVDVDKIITSPNLSNLSALKFYILLFLHQHTYDFKEYHGVMLLDTKVFKDYLITRDLFFNILDSERRSLLKFPEQKASDMTMSPPIENEDHVRSLIFSARDHVGDIRYKSALETITDTFELKDIQRFAGKFLSSSNKHLPEFFIEFLERDMKYARRRPKEGVIILDRVVAPVAPVEIKKKEIPKGGVCGPMREVMNRNLRACAQMYREIPWIPQSVTIIYLSTPDLIETDITPYILKNNLPTNIQGVDWYPINKYYYTLQCNPDYIKVQRQDTLYFYDRVDNSLHTCFKIAFVIGDEVLYQDEVMFKKETEYIEHYNRTDADKISDVSLLPINTEALEVAKKYAREMLVINGKDIVDSEYVDKLVQEASDGALNTGVLFDRLAKALIIFTPKLEFLIGRDTLTKLKMFYQHTSPSELLACQTFDHLIDIYSPELGVSKVVTEKITDALKKASTNDAHSLRANLYLATNDDLYFKYSEFSKPFDGITKNYLPMNWKKKRDKLSQLIVIQARIKQQPVKTPSPIIADTSVYISLGLFDLVQKDLGRMRTELNIKKRDSMAEDVVGPVKTIMFVTKSEKEEEVVQDGAEHLDDDDNESTATDITNSSTLDGESDTSNEDESINDDSDTDYDEDDEKNPQSSIEGGNLPNVTDDVRTLVCSFCKAKLRGNKVVKSVVYNCDNNIKMVPFCCTTCYGNFNWKRYKKILKSSH